MAVADAKQKFLVVEAGSCGSSGDAGIFLRSNLNTGLSTAVMVFWQGVGVQRNHPLPFFLPQVYVEDH